jgi:hypothetical protein
MNLASKFPEVKFLRSVSSVCIPNYPDKNLPTIFIYNEGDMKKQFVGPIEFGGMNFTQDGRLHLYSHHDCCLTPDELFFQLDTYVYHDQITQ